MKFGNISGNLKSKLVDISTVGKECSNIQYLFHCTEIEMIKFFINNSDRATGNIANACLKVTGEGCEPMKPFLASPH